MPAHHSGVATTEVLLERARAGDDGAVGALCRRLLPRLNRWATGRLPRYARSLVDTGDVVQEVLVRTLRHVGTIDDAHEGALAAYLRAALANRIREELRRTRRVPQRGELDTDAAGHEASPLEELIGHDASDRYEAVLAHLAPRDREAIVQRMELGMSHAEVAEALGLPSAEAARKTVSRALLRLARGMRVGGVGAGHRICFARRRDTSVQIRATVIREPATARAFTHSVDTHAGEGRVGTRSGAAAPAST